MEIVQQTIQLIVNILISKFFEQAMQPQKGVDSRLKTYQWDPIDFKQQRPRHFQIFPQQFNWILSWYLKIRQKDLRYIQMRCKQTIQF
ncbi:unnamed protein product [Paramecium pentaurelia]|uniref:Uncharacterized protein n=1 Tax=Paramecium pentaurelia TaxID=43138 RepID=A0A8S1T3C8_9CILI|nr:unnamed protein product [Paramecium pentaurelia]